MNPSLIPILDLRGLKCPQPLLKVRLALKELSRGAELKIFLDDGASIADLRLLFKTLHLQILEDQGQDNEHIFLILK